MRYIRANGATYFRAEDVAAYIRSLGATEDTDVRTRLNAAASEVIVTPCRQCSLGLAAHVDPAVDHRFEEP